MRIIVIKLMSHTMKVCEKIVKKRSDKDTTVLQISLNLYQKSQQQN